MNRLTRYLAISASLAVASQAAPFIAVGDGAELFATGVLGVRSDDNILLASDTPPPGSLGNKKESDVIFEITPGLDLTFGKGAQTQGSLKIADIFTNYADNSGLNTNLAQGDFVTKYNDGKSKLGINLGYHELNQNTVDTRGLVRRDVSTGNLNAEVDVSELTGVGGEFTYNHENFHPNNYVDADTITIPVNFYYKWTPKIDLSLGYQYRDFQCKNGLALDSTDNFFNIGARGEFTPLLTGKFAIGYTQRRFSGGYKSRSGLGVQSSFAYAVSAKSSVQFGVTNDFGTSPTGEQQKNLTANLTFDTKLSEVWSVNAGVNYRAITYNFNKVGRTDDYYEAVIGAGYTINNNVRLVGSYTYRTYKSDVLASEFDNNVFAISAIFRY